MIRKPGSEIRYQEIARLHEFQNFYEKAVKLAIVDEKVEESESPLRVLDMGGGRGHVGNILERIFGDKLEYVNVDTDKPELRFSPGTQIHGDYFELPKIVGGRRFDYIFCLNIEARDGISSHTLREMERLERRYNEPTWGGLWEKLGLASVGIGSLTHRLALLNAALVSSPGSVFITGGIITQDTLNGIRQLMAEGGFFLQESVNTRLSPYGSKMLAIYDSQNRGGEESRISIREMARVYSHNQRILKFKKLREFDEKALLEKCDKARQELLELRSYVQVQERFFD